MHWTDAQFCVCTYLDSRDNSLYKFQKVSGFYSRVDQRKAEMLRTPRQKNGSKKNSNIAESETNLILVSCGIRLQYTVQSNKDMIKIAQYCFYHI